MAAKSGTLEVLAMQLGSMLEPLQTRLQSDQVLQLFADLGLQFPPELLQSGLVSALNTGVTAVEALPGLITQLTTSIENGDKSGIMQASAKLFEQFGTIISTFAPIGEQINAVAGSLPGMVATEVTTFAQKLPSALVDYLVISYLEEVFPTAIGIANFLGILEWVNVPDSGDPTHPPYVKRHLQLEKVGRVISSPADALQILYQ